jgi:hypothetical protein
MSVGSIQGMQLSRTDSKGIIVIVHAPVPAITGHKHMKQFTCGPPKWRPESMGGIFKENISETFLKSNNSACCRLHQTCPQTMDTKYHCLDASFCESLPFSQSSRIDLTLFGMFL